ncbi:MAG TPA: methyltransferase domain-containing protein [Phycisphaerales bacterium]|nr:methyltransferase domain-containing protein [Phycisphaerales bacterium]
MNDGMERLNEWMWGYRATRVLHVLAGLKVFARLEQEPMTAAALASAFDVEAGLLEKLLIAGTAMGLLKKDGSTYLNTPLSSEYLVEGKPLYQGHIIAHAANVWEVWTELPAKVGLQTAERQNTDSHQHFILGMHNITMAGRGSLFLEAIDLSGCKSLLDVGGGPGTYSILACRHYPDLKATVFDLPETIAIAQTVIAQHGLSERIAVRRGSWDKDEFGKGYDAALLSNVLHGPTSQAGMKLQKTFSALRPGGLLAVQEFLLTDDKTGPLIPALFNVMVGAYSQAELTAEIERAGFTDVRLAARNDAVGGAWLTAAKPA